MKIVKDVRDGAATRHLSNNFVSDYGDVVNLVTVKRECLGILGTV